VAGGLVAKPLCATHTRSGAGSDREGRVDVDDARPRDSTGMDSLALAQLQLGGVSAGDLRREALPGVGAQIHPHLEAEGHDALDARVRAELRDWLRRLHDEMHVTTVFVTHDQEEAMEVADQIAVVNRGRIEQVGAPRDLYERPATEYVNSFLRPTTRLGESWVRPHDLEVMLDPADGATEAMIERIVHLGFEVRVELVRADDEKIWAQVTRDRCEELELATGQIVYVRPSLERVFAEA
jgi:sulfate transport system ATP-binding protein